MIFTSFHLLYTKICGVPYWLTLPIHGCQYLVTKVIPDCSVCEVVSVMSDSVRPYGTIACRAPPFMIFSRQEYWSGLPCPSPGDLPDPGMEPTTLNISYWQAGSLQLVLPGKPPSLIRLSQSSWCL